MQSLTERQKRIVQRMSSGEEFYSRSSPRMSKAEGNALFEAGFVTQCESIHGADTSAGYAYYPLNLAQWIEKAKEHGLIS